GEAAHDHVVDLIDAGRPLVSPADVVLRARGKDLYLRMTRQSLGDITRVQLGTAVDVGAVALDDDRELHDSDGGSGERSDGSAGVVRSAIGDLSLSSSTCTCDCSRLSAEPEGRSPSCVSRSPNPASDASPATGPRSPGPRRRPRRLRRRARRSFPSLSSALCCPGCPAADCAVGGCSGGTVPGRYCTTPSSARAPRSSKSRRLR